MTRISTDVSVTAARERAEAASSESGRDRDVTLTGGGATIDVCG